MKRVNALFLILALLAIASAVTTVIYTRATTVEVLHIPMDLRVDSVAGFNLDTDAIHFGKIPPGNEGLRNITLTNKKEFPLRAELRVEGVLTPWIGIYDNLVIIEPNSNKTIMLIAAIPQNTEYGLYKGQLVVVLRRA